MKNFLSSTIIKLTLQPLIENAIYHGVKLNRNQGFIGVKVFQLGIRFNLKLMITDMALSEDRLLQIEKKLMRLIMIIRKNILASDYEVSMKD